MVCKQSAVMENHCSARERTKSYGWTGHRCERWWWLLLCVAVSLPCTVYAKFSGDTVSVNPKGDIYVLYGDNLTIFCSAGEDYTSEDISFTWSGNVIPREIVNKTTIRLFIERPKEQPRQTVYCKNLKTSQNAITSVIVGSPPANVNGFNCISKNLEVLNCSWTTPDLIIFTNYSLAYYMNGYKTKPCVASIVENSLTRYCTYNTTSAPVYRQQSDTFHFNLVSTNMYGKNIENFTIDHYSVVKPDPPMNLQNVSESPHSVLLQWNIPVNMYDFLNGGVEHKIEYQIAKIDDTSHFRRVNTIGLPAHNKTYRYNLANLPYAHMQYGVRIYIKPIRATSDRFWSDFSNIVVYTPSERPKRPPDMAAGAFFQNTFEGYRVVCVYWKQLEEYEEAGANFTYKIVVKERDNSNPKTYAPDKNKSLGYLVLDKASLGAMEIFVWSYNEKGSSENRSQLYISAEHETRSLHVNSFSKLAYENGTYELSWIGIDNIDNYTLFWCHHNTTDVCNGRINFTNLDPMENRYIINLPRIYRYQFAIAANKDAKTSGMIWAKCDISKEVIAMFGFPIVFTDHDAPGKSFVKLSWSMNCILKEGTIIGYNISYCPVIQTSSMCDKTDKNLSQYIDDPKTMFTTIENLEPYRTYQFTMALNTIYGLKTIENTTVRITTLEDAPTIPRNVTISNVRNNSLDISWDRPEHINGHISKIKYVISNYNRTILEVKYDDKLSNELRRQVTLENLDAFTNYSLRVQACNEGHDNYCSVNTNPINLRTCIGSPSKLGTPKFKYSPDLLTWEPPAIFGGTVDEYQIRVNRDDIAAEIIDTRELSFPLQQCQGTLRFKKYQVRAVNFDVDDNHGAYSDSDKVTLPTRDQDANITLKYPGDWSDETTVRCDGVSILFFVFILMGLLAVISAAFGILKLYKKIRKMKDIKPEFPKGLFVVPEKDLNKYPFSGLYPPEKDEKQTSDEMLLLPNSKTKVTPPEIKQKDADNCGSSDHTDSTGLSEASQGPIDRQNSTSDDDSHSSLHLEVKAIKTDNSNAIQEIDSSNADTESSRESSPYFNDSAFKKNKVSGYMQPVMNTVRGYVQSAPSPFKSAPQNISNQPASSSYVMAGLPSTIFANGISSSNASSHPPPPSGYIRPEDSVDSTSMNFPKLGPSSTKIFGSESLPIMPTLPPSTKNTADSSYIQLQSLDALPSHKQSMLNNVPLKPPVPPASSGYVSPEDAVINKHLRNIMSGGQLAEESAILDPAMSPDAYCRFSWSTDPTNDNLHSLLGNSPMN